MLSNKKYQSLIETSFPYGTVDVFVGKKNIHVMEIISELALNGSSTTTEIAKFVIEKYASRSGILGSTIVRNRAGVYYKLIQGRMEKKTGKKNIGKRYAGLVEHDYVFEVERVLNDKNKRIPKYFLTLKGCILALGFDFTKEQLREFINIASKYYITFAYLKKIVDSTGINFVHSIFFSDFKNRIINKYVNFNLDVRFYFSNISDLVEQSVFKHTRKIIENIINNKEYCSKNTQSSNIETLIENTKYYDVRKEDYVDSLHEFYYDKQDVEYFSREQSDLNLLYKLMRAVHVGYYSGYGVKIPSTPRKLLPRSKNWKEHQKYKKRSKEDIKLLSRLKQNSKL